jgi:hypothetical protein
MSPSEHRRAISRSRKAFAFFSVTGKAGTANLYTDCLRKIQTEDNSWPELALVLYKFTGLR